MGLSLNLVPFPLVKNPKNSFFKDFKHWHQAEMRQRPGDCVWLRCVFKKTLKSKEQVKLSTWLSPWIPADRNSRPNPRFPVSKWENCDKSGSPTAERWSTTHSYCQNHSTEEGRQKFSIQFLPGYGFHSGFASRSFLVTWKVGGSCGLQGKKCFLEMHMKNLTQQDGWWGELK